MGRKVLLVVLFNWFVELTKLQEMVCTKRKKSGEFYDWYKVTQISMKRVKNIFCSVCTVKSEQSTAYLNPCSTTA